ncbi:phosphomannomutase/phosphoglucomutase [Reinekea blandensis]|uniref:phosphomannomutase n=1 Tax=Reinekea blandensis MED297 TaxID=314283 RepID=A4BAA3_9GAMM|nr:phosphomannomutase/phosphoglucomutase [Reinekea blandensis]EAR10859.1 Phosphomannomutase [Reinekea sp. MED297] [Reinekea blandensis MED297]
MAKKKTTPKKKGAAPKKSSKGNRSVLSFLLLPILFVLIAMGAAAYVVINILIAPVNDRHQQALIDNIANQYDAYINNVLEQHDSLMNQIASSQYVIDQVSQGDAELLLEAESFIASQIPYGLSVHVFPVRQSRLIPDDTPPLSHAGLDMIRKAEQGQNLSMEAHQHDGEAYLQSVRAVRNNSGRLIGTVAIAQSLDYLSEQLGGIDGTKGNLVIEQQFEGAPRQTLLTYGAKNTNEVIRLGVSNPNWTLTFQPSDELAYASVLSTNLLWTVFGALAIACILPIFLAGQRVQQTLRHDANAFAREVQNLLSGQKTAHSDFEFAIFSTLAKTINRMRMGKQQSGRGPSASTGGAILDTPARAPTAQDDVTDFDVSMMDSDSDLLGMNQSSAPAQPQSAVQPDIFRAYDIRGIVGQALTADTAQQIGLAIGSEAYDRGEQTIIVGRDGRLSSPDLTQALIRGLQASGRDVIDIGMVPTPVCYFACQHLKVGSCVMVTGSHNPANYNGFKIVLGGNTLMDDEIKGLYHRIENQNFLSGSGNLTNQDVSAAYLQRIGQDVKAKRPLKVVIDCGNGVAGNLAPQLVKGVGCHVLPLFCDIDGNFPNHHPDPSDPANMQDLTRTVVETRADIGLAFDGDGDRIGLVTNSGKVIPADRLLMLLSKQVLQNNPGATILFDVKSSRRLKNLILGFGGKPVMWKTGHSFMKRKMRETGAALAGEMSGHIFYQDRWFGFDDALYTAARLIEILADQNETIDTLLAELPQDLSTPELSISTTDERKFRVIEALQRNAQFPNGQITDIDGVRVDYQDGWGLVRASNTSPKLVCRFEADNADALRRIQDQFKQQMLGVDSQLQIPF